MLSAQVGVQRDARLCRLPFKTGVRAIQDGDMAERHFSVTPEGVPCVRRYHDNIARFGDEVDTLNSISPQ
jgi:hypothetical protein